jgi:plastocyanin
LRRTRLGAGNIKRERSSSLKRVKYLVSFAVVVGVAASWAAYALGSSTSAGHGVVVLAKDKGVTFAANRYIQDNMFFAPGTVNVKSGESLTFKFGDAKAMEPHTLTIVKKRDLPRTSAQVENCEPCQRYATPHLKNPKAPPDEHNPIVHWVIDKGQPGLDIAGDSIAIQQPGPHKSITARVSAPAGSVLYFVCAVHPWMQGKIIVH